MKKKQRATVQDIKNELARIERRKEYPATLSFERVDIFLRVKGRLPNQEGDKLTQEILDEYCRLYEKDKLTQGIVPLDYMYQLIKTGEITPTSQ